ncbi:hypothetical protein ACFV9C_04035 [Kribbella sp. NPDC059898]|uniref:hypothetical protein n=1 Tax=Kribbella sp. NPDC059898 TaxID=3346995 RepID=UPI003646DDE2
MELLRVVRGQADQDPAVRARQALVGMATAARVRRVLVDQVRVRRVRADQV